MSLRILNISGGEIKNDRIRENKGDNSPMSKTGLKQGIEEKWGDCSNVSKTIVKQGIEGSLGYCDNGPIVVSSPMSKTSFKQGIEDKWENLSNVSKNIVKQGIEGSLRYCSNGPTTRGKSDFKGGMTTYAQKWKTSEICKRKSAGGLQA